MIPLALTLPARVRVVRNHWQQHATHKWTLTFQRFLISNFRIMLKWVFPCILIGLNSVCVCACVCKNKGWNYRLSNEIDKCQYRRQCIWRVNKRLVIQTMINCIRAKHFPLIFWLISFYLISTHLYSACRFTAVHMFHHEIDISKYSVLYTFRLAFALESLSPSLMKLNISIY